MGTSLFLALMLIVMSPESLAQQYQMMSIQQSLWSPNQTITGVSSVTTCSAICARNGQCQFQFDPVQQTCLLGFAPLTTNQTAPFVDVYYKDASLNFTWGPYGNWSACNVSCGGSGYQNKTRVCSSGDPCSPAAAVPSCSGSDVAYQNCSTGVTCTTPVTTTTMTTASSTSTTTTATTTVTINTNNTATTTPAATTTISTIPTTTTTTTTMTTTTTTPINVNTTITHFAAFAYPSGKPTDVSLNPTFSPAAAANAILPTYTTSYNEDSNGLDAPATVVVDNGLLTCGGWGTTNNGPLQKCNFLGFGATVQVSHSTLLLPRAYPAAANLASRSVWLTGGTYANAAADIANSTEVLNPTNKTWSYGPTLPYQLFCHTVLPLDAVNDEYLFLGGKIYNVSVGSGLGSKGVYKYSWKTSTWTTLASTLYFHLSTFATGLLTASTGAKTVVMFSGGAGSMETYSFATNLWTAGPSAAGGPYTAGYGFVSQGQFFAVVFSLTTTMTVLLSSDLSGWINRTDIPVTAYPGFLGAGYQYCPLNCGYATCANKNTSLGGVDFSASQSNVSSASACKDLCQHMTGCPFYSYSSVNLTCYFKTTNASVTTNSAYTSGPPTCGCVQVGMAYPTASYLNLIATVPDAEMCQWYCIQDVNCYYFTYYTQGYSTSAEWMNCYTLGSTAVTATATVGVISAVKICP